MVTLRTYCTTLVCDLETFNQEPALWKSGFCHGQCQFPTALLEKQKSKVTIVIEENNNLSLKVVNKTLFCIKQSVMIHFFVTQKRP